MRTATQPQHLAPRSAGRGGADLTVDGCVESHPGPPGRSDTSLRIKHGSSKRRTTAAPARREPVDAASVRALLEASVAGLERRFYDGHVDAEDVVLLTDALERCSHLLRFATTPWSVGYVMTCILDAADPPQPESRRGFFISCLVHALCAPAPGRPQFDAKTLRELDAADFDCDCDVDTRKILVALEESRDLLASCGVECTSASVWDATVMFLSDIATHHSEACDWQMPALIQALRYELRRDPEITRHVVPHVERFFACVLARASTGAFDDNNDLVFDDAVAETTLAALRRACPAERQAAPAAAAAAASKAATSGASPRPLPDSDDDTGGLRANRFFAGDRFNMSPDSADAPDDPNGLGSSLLDPVDPPAAAAAPAAAPAAPLQQNRRACWSVDGPPSAPTEQVAFWEELVFSEKCGKLRHSAANPTPHIRVSEDLFKRDGEGNLVHHMHRTLTLALTGKSSFVRVALTKGCRNDSNAAVVEGTARALRRYAVMMAEREGANPVRIPGQLSAAQQAHVAANKALTATTAMVPQLASVMAKDHMSDDLPFAYGAFPLRPSDAALAFAHFVRYRSCCVLSNLDVEKATVDALHTALHDTTDIEQPSHWALRPRAPGDVEEVLGSFRTRVQTWSDLPDVHGIRGSFSALAARTIAGYAADPPKSQLRDSKLRALIALPRLHLRKLEGKASDAVAHKHLRAQVSGDCLATEDAQRVREARVALHRRNERVKHLVAAELDTRAIATAERCAAQGEIRRANAALSRDNAPRQPLNVQVANLVKLHPKAPPPTDIVLPEKPVYTEESHPDEVIVKQIRAGLNKGTAGGVDGWTTELLLLALEHKGFAHDYAAVARDIINGAISDSTELLLTASRLLGTPKDDGGTRPLTCGTTLMKGPAACALAAAKSTLMRIFHSVQRGCSFAGGADGIIHYVRELIREWTDGRVVVTTDFGNAFNSVCRRAIWRALLNIPELQGLFKTAYAQHANLFVFGDLDELAYIISSEQGARQGTTEGPPFFALALQPALEKAARVKGCCVRAYLDDATFVCESLAVAHQVLEAFAADAKAVGLELKPSKCEILAAGPNSLSAAAWNTVPAGSLLRAFKTVAVLKLLGASVAATDAAEEQHLNRRMLPELESSPTTRRLRDCVGPAGFAILRQCFVPRYTYATRVHAPAVTANLAAAVDAKSMSFAAHWAQAPIGPRQRLILGAPRALGGLGVTQLTLTLHTSHNASLALFKARAAKPVPNRHATAAVYSQLLEREGAADPQLMRHLEINALKGADAGVTCCSLSVHPDVFGACLRDSLMADTNVASRRASDKLPCPGCQREFAKHGEWGAHVDGCTRVHGGRVTRRHNFVVSFLRTTLRDAALPCEATEPRDMQVFTCGCGLRLRYAQWQEHGASCPRTGGVKLVHNGSGPDIRYTNANGFVVAGDVTVRSANAASNAGMSAAEILTAASKEKIAKYGDMVVAAGALFIPFPALSNGHLGAELITFLRDAAARMNVELGPLTTKASAIIARGTAQARQMAEWQAGIGPRSLVRSGAATLARYFTVPLQPRSTTAAAAPAAGILPDPRPITPGELLQAVRELKVDNSTFQAAVLERIDALDEAHRRELEEARRRTADPTAANVADTDPAAAARHLQAERHNFEIAAAARREQEEIADAIAKAAAAKLDHHRAEVAATIRASAAEAAAAAKENAAFADRVARESQHDTLSAGQVAAQAAEAIRAQQQLTAEARRRASEMKRAAAELQRSIAATVSTTVAFTDQERRKTAAINEALHSQQPKIDASLADSVAAHQRALAEEEAEARSLEAAREQHRTELARVNRSKAAIYGAEVRSRNEAIDHYVAMTREAASQARGSAVSRPRASMSSTPDSRAGAVAISDRTVLRRQHEDVVSPLPHQRDQASFLGQGLPAQRHHQQQQQSGRRHSSQRPDAPSPSGAAAALHHPDATSTPSAQHAQHYQHQQQQHQQQQQGRPLSGSSSQLNKISSSAAHQTPSSSSPASVHAAAPTVLARSAAVVSFSSPPSPDANPLASKGAQQQAPRSVSERLAERQLAYSETRGPSQSCAPAPRSPAQSRADSCAPAPRSPAQSRSASVAPARSAASSSSARDTRSRSRSLSIGNPTFRDRNHEIADDIAREDAEEAAAAAAAAGSRRE